MPRVSPHFNHWKILRPALESRSRPADDVQTEVVRRGLTGVSALVRRFERHRRRTDVGDALLGVDGHSLGAVHRLLRRPRQLRLAADDAAVLAAAASAAPGRPGAAADAHRHAGVVQLVFVVERLQREAPMGLLATAASLRDVRVVLAHRLRLVDLQLRVQSLQLALKRAAPSPKLLIHRVL